MRIPLTPDINTTGTFVANTPFELPAGVIFKLDAVRTFPELVRRNIDVFETYYSPAGLTRQDYIDDANVSAAILVLKSTDGEERFVPNTYLASYPGQNTIQYNRNVLVFDLGLTPDYVDVSKLNSDIVALISAQVGVTTTAELTVMAYEGTVSEDDHVKMEATRKRNIRQTEPLTDQLKAAQDRANELQAYSDQLLAIIKSAGLSN